ncbi:GAF domain-containing protein [Pleurocapsa sp. PCC 7319]|uniref:GAF domain-containing protein n=1 Tax=Pleurocapsa sp. PCC 7319 TaxID=118161 RepID=UPI000380FD00|nr:GAF domain-containing protein [Pleurocapsa sp. PCC 7319]
MNIESSLSLSGISSNGNQINSLPTEFFSKLCKINTEEDLLQASVGIVYQSLKCDRVVVYSMQSESLCKIVAEAVTPGFAQILGTTIKDPCFEARYIDKYQKGRVRAITNIYDAGMTPCYVENLEKIDVKSNLVVPLTRHDNSLYGLLVMHQCSGTRKWEQPEVEFALRVAEWTMERVFQQLAYLELENQVKNSQAAQQIVKNIVTQMHGVETSQEVLNLAVVKAKELLNCDRVIVYGLQADSMGEIVAEATIPALASILGSVIKDPCFEYRYHDQYQQGRVRAIPNIYEAGMTLCYTENLAKIGVRANLVAPIIWDNGKLYGLLVAHHCFSFKDWQKSEIEYFKQIAFHTGLSLSKAKLKDQLQSIKTGTTELNNIKKTISIAKSKIQQVQKPIQNTSQIIVEINNLNKLLERELNLINQTSSLQTRKDTKLIQIIIKKLTGITSKLQQSLYIVSNDQYELDTILDEAVTQLFDNTDS